MTLPDDTPRAPFTFPTLPLFLLAALIGQLSFEAYAWLVSPLVFGPTLEPANLVVALTGQYLGLNIGYATAFVLHLIIGTVGFAAVVVGARYLTGIRYLWAGALAGLLLWFVAQGILAPAIGRNFMMDFGVYTQSSFVAHVGMSMVIGAILGMGVRAKAA